MIKLYGSSKSSISNSEKLLFEYKVRNLVRIGIKNNWSHMKLTCTWNNLNGGK